jgi:hypothetical protein
MYSSRYSSYYVVLHVEIACAARGAHYYVVFRAYHITCEVIIFSLRMRMGRGGRIRMNRIESNESRQCM